MKRIIVLGFVVILILSACSSGNKNPTLAKFKGGKVLQDEYIDHYLLSTQYKPNKFPTVDNLKEILTKKALEKIAVSEALQRGIDQDSSYKEIATRNENRLLFYRYMRQEIIDKIVTDSLINKFYSEYTPQYRMRYIMRPVPKGSSEKFRLTQKDTIEYVYKLLISGQDFQELAKKYSQDITTNKKGGDLGFVIRESMGDAKLRAVMDTLKEYSYSKPFMGYEGYYILYKENKRYVPVPPFSTVKDKIWGTLYHTRRHLVREGAKEHFLKYSPTYHYQVNENVINELMKKAGWKESDSKLAYLHFEKLTDEDMEKVLATYDGGAIKAFEIFANKKKAPDNMLEFEEKLNNLAQQHILAQRARDLGIQQQPELEKKIKDSQNSLLMAFLYEQVVKKKAQAMLDSLLQVQNIVGEDRQKKRFEFERQLKTAFENDMLTKYQFKLVTKNFIRALEEARKRKEIQNEERSKNSSMNS